MVDYPLAQEQIEKLSEKERLEYLVNHQLAALGLDNFKDNALERINALGISDPELVAKFSSDEFLNTAFERVQKKQKENETAIIEAAVKKLEGTEKSPEKRKARDNATTIGEKVAKGPDLVILDGGPGTGKSFGLNKAAKGLKLDMKREQIFCAGSTPTAAKDLRDDMTRKVKEGETFEGKNEGDTLSEPQGGYTIKDMMIKGSKAQKAWEEAKKQNPAPILIVDEAGLLDDEELRFVLEQAPGRVVLAGDCRQIPPEKGNQPFAMLVESTKGTPAYVNAPYVYRQGLVSEKAITSGIYTGQNNSMENGCSIDTKLAGEFLSEAVKSGKGSGIKFEYTAKNGKTGGLSEYIEETYKVDNADKEKYPDKTDQEIRMIKFVDDLAKEAATLKKEDLKGIIEEGNRSEINTYSEKEAKEIGKEEGDSKEPITDPKKLTQYLAAVMVCQKMGACAYEALGRVSEVEPEVRIPTGRMDAEAEMESFYQTTARPYAQTDTTKVKTALEEKFAVLEGQRKAVVDRENPTEEERKNIEAAEKDMNKAAGKAFKKGRLAITATPEEATEFNETVRAERYGKKDEPLHVGEPIIFKDGTKRVATPADVKAAEDNGGMPKDCKFAYALDVKSTQGLSQSGPVDMLVRAETQDRWQGGEVLVGASRHKGTAEFNILLEPGASKEAVYEQSTHQYAAERNITPPKSKKLRAAAESSLGGAPKPVEKPKEKTTEQKGISSLNATALKAVTAKGISSLNTNAAKEAKEAKEAEVAKQMQKQASANKYQSFEH